MTICAGRLTATLLGLVAATLLTGCGQSAKGVVSGKVTVDDKPVRSGQVTFVGGPDSGKFFTVIGIDGRYSIDLKPGDYKVGVEPSATPPGGMMMANMPPPKAPKDAPAMKDPSGSVTAEPVDPKELKNPAVIPTKYRTPDSSTLTVTVQPSGTTFDIPMKSKG